ncbi:MAG: GNAT family N-acetyltransferase [Ornithinibacter sp.]
MPSPYPLRTERLVLRVMRTTDAAPFAAYRNDPEVARYQSWNLPFTEQDALSLLCEQDDRDDVSPGLWTQFALERDGELIGDVCVRIDDTGGVAEIGFTLARSAQGRGYAREAAQALVCDLVKRVGVERVSGELDPDNIASQRVLENVGLMYEATMKKSYLWRGRWADSMTYGATAQECRVWADRPHNTPDQLRLVPLTVENNRGYYALRTHHSQERFVAPMSWSFADALFPEVIDGAPVVPRLYGVEADGEPAAFVMIADVTAAHPEPYLWRLLVDRRHQRRGVGWRTLDLLCDLLRAEGCTTLVSSWVPGPGTPAPFYRKYGFVETGEIVDGETLVRLQLREPDESGD